MIASLPMTPASLPDPGKPPVGSKTLSRWNQFLGAIAAGEALPDSMLKFYITRADIEACVRSDPAEYDKWQAARMAAHKKVFTAMILEDIFAFIAGGLTTKDALESAGLSDHAQAFNKLCALDSEVHRQFTDACKARTLHMAEEILEIADDDTNDVVDGGERGSIPNNAAVNRSKLRVETRMRLMGSYNKKLYGEKSGDVTVAVQVNHAATLEEARTRSANRTPVKLSPRAIQDAIDAEVIVPEVVVDTDWLDAPAKLDTSWLD